MHRMKKKLKDELDNKNTVQEYICPSCGRRLVSSLVMFVVIHVIHINRYFDGTKVFLPYFMFRYTALDALRLVSPEDEYFHCESCNGELVAESDKLAGQEMGDGDDNARRRRREKLRDMLQNLEVCSFYAF